MTVEPIKYGGRKLWIRNYQLIKRVWETEQIPQEWSTAIICPLYKKRNKLECSNYRGISLLNVTYKILKTYSPDILSPMLKKY
jgi:hypothetical protein